MTTKLSPKVFERAAELASEGRVASCWQGIARAISETHYSWTDRRYAELFAELFGTGCVFGRLDRSIALDLAALICAEENEKL